MFTKRTLLIYNFGLAVVFVVIGALSLMTFEQFLKRPTVVPPFDPASHKAIETEQDIERLRSQAIFYFELGRLFKQRRYADTDVLIHDFQHLCYLLAAVFAVGGAISFVVTRPNSAK